MCIRDRATGVAGIPIALLVAATPGAGDDLLRPGGKDGRGVRRTLGGRCLSIQKAKFVLAQLKKKNVSVIKRSELFQMCRGKFFKKTEEIFPTLELLEGHG